MLFLEGCVINNCVCVVSCVCVLLPMKTTARVVHGNHQQLERLGTNVSASWVESCHNSFTVLSMVSLYQRYVLAFECMPFQYRLQ